MRCRGSALEVFCLRGDLYVGFLEWGRVYTALYSHEPHLRAFRPGRPWRPPQRPRLTVTRSLNCIAASLPEAIRQMVLRALRACGRISLPPPFCLVHHNLLSEAPLAADSFQLATAEQTS